MALQLPDSMLWLIYQAYLQGPSALLRLFEDAFGRHALYGTPEPNQQQRTIDALSEQVGQLKAQNERLQAEVSDLRRTAIARAGDGAQLSPGADDVEAQGSEDRDALRDHGRENLEQNAVNFLGYDEE